MKPILQNTAFLLFFVSTLACSDQASKTTATNNSAPLDTATKMNTGNEKWMPLFDGKTLDGWHAFNKKGEIKNWTIEEEAMVCLGAAQGDTGGDIVSDAEYENFELTWEWKIDKGGNSGLMYHVVEDPKYKAPYETGPEYQMLDDIGFPGKLEEWQKTGADYAMTSANDKKKVKPVGEWNTSKIVCNNGHVEHWLNGEKIVEFQAWNETWNKAKKEGKWKDFPDFGVAKKGRIALQDHGNKAYFKKIMIREL